MRTGSSAVDVRLSQELQGLTCLSHVLLFKLRHILVFTGPGDYATKAVSAGFWRMKPEDVRG